MNTLTLPAHLATLAVHGVATVAVVDAPPTELADEAWMDAHEPFGDGWQGAHPRLPLDLTGQRIALRADSEGAHAQMANGWWASPTLLHRDCDGLPTLPLHPGCIVGSAVVEAVLPILDGHGAAPTESQACLMRFDPPYRDEGLVRRLGWGNYRDLDDQLAYQDFPPGAHALILTDAAPCEQRCPLDLHGMDCCGEVGYRPPIPFDTDQTWSVWP